MLETIRQTIQNSDNKSFSEHYLDYLMEVQDENIVRESNSFCRHNKLDSVSIMMTLDADIGELEKW